MDGLEWLLIVIGVLGVLKTLGGGTFAASSSGASATASASGSSAASDSASGQPVVAKKKPLTQLLALVGASPGASPTTLNPNTIGPNVSGSMADNVQIPDYTGPSSSFYDAGPAGSIEISPPVSTPGPTFQPGSSFGGVDFNVATGGYTGASYAGPQLFFPDAPAPSGAPAGGSDAGGGPAQI